MLRPITPRPHLPQPAPRWPRLPERAGLGQPRQRLDTREIYEPTWNQQIHLSLVAADGATTIVTSDLIHNPFRINSVSSGVVPQNSVGVDIRWFLTQADEAQTAADVLASQLLTGQNSEISNGLGTGLANTFVLGGPGSVIQRYPARIALVIVNASGNVIIANLAVGITHLCRADHSTYPAATAGG